jgi:hypothetical protein
MYPREKISARVEKIIDMSLEEIAYKEKRTKSQVVEILLKNAIDEYERNGKKLKIL